MELFYNCFNIKTYFKAKKALVIRINQVRNFYLLEVKTLNFKQTNSLIISKLSTKKNYYIASLFRTYQSAYINRNV